MILLEFPNVIQEIGDPVNFHLTDGILYYR